MKIAFLHRNNSFALELLQRFRTMLPQDDLIEWIEGSISPPRDMDVLLALGTVGRQLLNSQPKLALIQTTSDGYEDVDIEAASELGIWVSYAPSELTGNATSVA